MTAAISSSRNLAASFCSEHKQARDKSVTSSRCRVRVALPESLTKICFFVAKRGFWWVVRVRRTLGRGVRSIHAMVEATTLIPCCLLVLEKYLATQLSQFRASGRRKGCNKSTRYGNKSRGHQMHAVRNTCWYWASARALSVLAASLRAFSKRSAKIARPSSDMSSEAFPFARLLSSGVLACSILSTLPSFATTCCSWRP